MKLLTESNAKILKSRKYGFFTAGLHLSPATLVGGGRTTCPWASSGCTDSCLNTSGHGKFDHTQQARLRRTVRFFEERDSFLTDLVVDIGSAAKKAAKKGLAPAIRLNLTSDIAWESMKLPLYDQSIVEMFPTVRMYDYTKSLKRMEKFLKGEMPSNYHLTFSRSECNDDQCAKVLDMGGNVAVVFADKLPAKWWGRRVISGDENDLRFLDPESCIVGLVAKGKAKQDRSGFVIEP